MIRLLGLLCAFLVLAGCSTTNGNGSVASPAAVAPVAVAPASVTIPKIGAQSTLIPLGLAADGTLEVPDVRQPGQAGWYTRGVQPGQVGPAVIVGHVDGGGHPGVFYRLHELAVGDTVQVGRVDGSTLTFRVYRVQEVRKAAFSSAEVYGNVPRPELRLITCGGTWVGGQYGYEDNWVIYAST